MPISLKSILFPATTLLPSTSARTPFPGRASNFTASARSSPSSLALRTTASARGCSEGRCAEATRRSISFSLTPTVEIFAMASMVAISVTSGLPTVRVPVLSKATMLSFSEASRASPLLIRMPSSAPLPMPTVMAVGVARPRAQGQATTNTDIRAVREKSRVLWATKYQ